MKNTRLYLLISFCTLLSFIIGACQSDTLLSEKEVRYEEIAKSELYGEYQTAKFERMYLVGSNSYDKDAVWRLLDEHPELDKICDFAPDWFKSIRGGQTYLETACRNEQLLAQLQERYNYQDFSLEELRKIREIYHIWTNHYEHNRLKERLLSGGRH